MLLGAYSERVTRLSLIPESLLVGIPTLADLGSSLGDVLPVDFGVGRLPTTVSTAVAKLPSPEEASEDGLERVGALLAMASR